MSISIAAVVVLLLLTQLAGSAQAQAKEGSGEGQLQYQLGKIPLFPNSTRIRVCASPWTPAVDCTVDSSAPGREQWETASGYEIEVFKQMMPVLGWTDEMIDFKCLGWSEMLDELAANETSCDIAPSGLGPKLDRMEKGIIFSDPTIQSGLSVMMVSQDSMTRSIWYFFSAMTWEVWVALLVTGIVAGFVVWLMEVGSKSLTMDTRDFSVVVWDTFGRPVQMRDYRLASVAGNTVGWVWSFLAFIVMCLYNAALTANMTIEQLSALPRRMSDLATLRVGSWVDYNESVRGPQCARPDSATMPRSHSRSAPSRQLLEYGIEIVPFPWEDTTDEIKMLDALVSGEIDALVLDEPALRILDANNCSTMIIEEIKPGTHLSRPVCSHTRLSRSHALTRALRSLACQFKSWDRRRPFRRAHRGRP